MASDSTQRDPLAHATDYHAPIMVAEVLSYLQPTSGGVYIDGTLGGGGHSEAILEASAPDGRVIGIDRDPEAIAATTERLARFGERFTAVQANYSEAARVAREIHGGPVDGWLVDAGVSSHQLDEPARGFSFREAGPLDMRMSKEGRTAKDLLESIEHGALTRILREYGEVKAPSRIAGVILAAVARGEIETTQDLANVADAAGAGAYRNSSINPATLVFQAIRIALNDELSHLREAVASLPDVVVPGGVGAFISFHSLEDRIVKLGFRDLANDCVCPPGLPMCGCDATAKVAELMRKPVQPQADEVAANPRSRSAKLRAARVL